MKNWFLLSLVCICCCLIACSEQAEISKYDNWQERNEAFIDSVATLASSRIVANEEQAASMAVGELFAVKDEQVSTDQHTYYIYCKKITANNEGRRPLYTETVSAFYYGSLITGDKFDGNFTGFAATYQGTLNPAIMAPTAFDAPTSFSVTGVISGWTAVLQFMRTSERWMVYIPWQCAYGSDGYSTIPGYSTLAFDIQLEKVVD